MSQRLRSHCIEVWCFGCLDFNLAIDGGILICLEQILCSMNQHVAHVNQFSRSKVKVTPRGICLCGTCNLPIDQGNLILLGTRFA